MDFNLRAIYAGDKLRIELYFDKPLPAFFHPDEINMTEVIMMNGHWYSRQAFKVEKDKITLHYEKITNGYSNEPKNSNPNRSISLRIDDCSRVGCDSSI